MAKMIADLELIAVADVLEAIEALTPERRRRVLVMVWSRVFAEADPPSPPAVGCRHPPFVPQGDTP